jgi:ATP-dependent DNA helicase DinG
MLFDVHLAVGGSVLTLFTNRRDMDELYGRLAAPLDREGLRLLVQSRGVSRKRVADEFIADERVSLFATKSFWEGFDAKGDTLRCVVIPRLPFGPVNDPVLEERRDRDRDWWAHYYLPEAVLELKQAAGRLIRSATDEGCLVLADTRLVGPKSYAYRFLEALPVREVERLPSDDLARVIRERFGR